jgi:hypothetical protein
MVEWWEDLHRFAEPILIGKVYQVVIPCPTTLISLQNENAFSVDLDGAIAMHIDEIWVVD